MVTIKAETQKDHKKNTFLHYRKRLRFEIFRRDKFRCCYCGRNVAAGIQLTLDHVVPKSKGGDFSKENLITACNECNRGKFDASLSKWELRELKRLWDSMRPQRSIIVIAQ